MGRDDDDLIDGAVKVISGKTNNDINNFMEIFGKKQKKCEPDETEVKELYESFNDIYQLIAGVFDIQMMIKHISEPLYQDYSYQGRAIGFIVRSGRILLGLFTQLILMIILGIMMVIWLLLPLVIIVKIIYIIFTLS